jgi:hypothetical protein
VSVSRTQSLSTIPGHRQQTRCGALPPAKASKGSEHCSSAPLPHVKNPKFAELVNFLGPPPVPVVVETINPTALSPLRCGLCIPPTTRAPCQRPWKIRSPTRLVVYNKESTTHAAFFSLFFPPVLPYHLSFVHSLPPTFWSSARFSECCSFLPTNIKCVPHCCFTNTSSHSTTLLLLNPMLLHPLLPNSCCAPYTLPIGTTPCPH